MAAWWLAYKPLRAAQAWSELEALACSYLDLFELAQPDDEFVERAHAFCSPLIRPHGFPSATSAS